MTGKAEYRSAKRSRKLIRNAVVELMADRDISQITVRDIAERADINRGTFYAHYRDIYDVLEQIENELIATLGALLDDFQSRGIIRTPLDLMLAIAEYLEEDLEFNRQLIRSRGANSFLLKLRKVVVQRLTIDKVLVRSVKNPVELQLCATYIAAGGVGLLQDWFNGDMTVPLRSIAVVLDRLVRKGMEDFFTGGVVPA